MHALSYAGQPKAAGTARIAVICAATLLLAGCNPQTTGNGSGNGNGNPLQPGAEQQVHLIWKQATSQWMVKLNNSNTEVPPANAHSVLAQNTGPTKFVVDINGPTTAKFKNQGALTVWTGNKNAPQAGINSPQILGPVLTNDGKLVFFDLNQGDPVSLNYEIHFDSGPSVDPIIDNGGTNSN